MAECDWAIMLAASEGITPFRKPSPSDSAGAIWDEFDAQQMTASLQKQFGSLLSLAGAP